MPTAHVGITSSHGPCDLCSSRFLDPVLATENSYKMVDVDNEEQFEVYQDLVWFFKKHFKIMRKNHSVPVGHVDTAKPSCSPSPSRKV